MHLILDVRMISDPLHGIGRYALSLLREFARIGHRHHFTLIASGDTLASFLPNYPNFIQNRTNAKLYGIREQIELPFLLRGIPSDVFHSMTYTAPLLQHHPLVITIFDLIHLKFPAKFSIMHRLYYRLIIRRLAERARKILTISESSKSDILELLGVPESKIQVIHLGVDKSFNPSRSADDLESFLAVHRIDGPYLLHVGNHRPHKNLNGLLRAFSLLVHRYRIPHRLLLSGFASPVLSALIEEARIGDRVNFLGRIGEENLPSLYRGADVFVFPSLWEGFGLPPLEAMACGTPVVAANRSSLPEVIGDAGLLVDPELPEALASEIYHLLDDPEFRADLCRRGPEQARKFTWERTAEQTMRVYEEIMEEG